MQSPRPMHHVMYRDMREPINGGGGPDFIWSVASPLLNEGAEVTPAVSWSAATGMAFGPQPGALRYGGSSFQTNGDVAKLTAITSAKLNYVVSAVIGSPNSADIFCEDADIAAVFAGPAWPSVVSPTAGKGTTPVHTIADIGLQFSVDFTAPVQAVINRASWDEAILNVMMIPIITAGFASVILMDNATVSITL